MSDKNKNSSALPNPVQEIGMRLREIRGAQSQAEFCASLGVHKNTYGGYERGDRTPDAILIANVCALYGIRLEWLLWGKPPMRADRVIEGPPDGTGESDAAPYGLAPGLVYLPLVRARLAAGNGSLETEADVQGYFAFRRDWIASKGNPAHLVLMKVSGDSMEPELRDGDMVLIDQAQRDPIPGRLYAVGIEDGIVVKLLDVAPGKLLLRSVNAEKYDPIEVNLRGDLAATVRIIGRVIWQCRER